MADDTPLAFDYDEAKDVTTVTFRDLPVVLRGELGTSGVMIGYGEDGGMVTVTLHGHPDQALETMKDALDQLP